jgi:CDP-glucose 4,6-dehydratase
MPVMIARCGNIYGGGDLNWERIVPGTVRSLLAGEAPVIRSDGRRRRDYLFVLDAVDAYRRLGEVALDGKWHGEAFNFGHGKAVTVGEIVQQIANVVQRPDLAPIILNRAADEIPDQYVDATKANERLQWRPQFSLRKGLELTVDWYRGLLAR